MLRALKGAISYIEASTTAGTPSDIMIDVIANRVANLKNMVTKLPANVDDMTAAIALLGESTCFSGQQKTDLLRAFHTSMQTGAFGDVGEDSNSKSQQIAYVENYLNDPMYEVLEDKSIMDDARTEHFVDFLHNILGCKFPDVATRKRITAIILLLHGGAVTARSAKAMFDMFATINKRKRDHRRHLPTTCKHFPEDPEDFMRLHPDRYPEDAPPVTPRLSVTQITECMNMVSARNTNTMLKTRRDQDAALLPLASSGSGREELPPAGMLQMMQGVQQGVQMLGQFMQMMNSSPGRGPTPGGNCNIRFNPIGDPPGQHVQRDGAGGPPVRHADTGGLQGHPSTPQSCIEDVRQPLPMATRVEERESGSQPIMQRSSSHVEGQFHTESQEGVDTAEDDVDKMLKGIGQPKSNKSMTIDRPPKVTKGSGTAKKPVTKHTLKDLPKDKPPPFGVKLPCIYNGCKIYGSSSRFRVVPKPGKSVYDHQVKIVKGNEKQAWAKVIEYCKNPKIPETSINSILRVCLV